MLLTLNNQLTRYYSFNLVKIMQSLIIGLLKGRSKLRHHLFLDKSNQQKIFHMSISIYGIIISDNLYSTNRIQEFVTFRKRLTINLEKTFISWRKNYCRRKFE